MQKSIVNGFYNPIGGYVESGKVIGALADYSRSLDVEVLEDTLVDEIIIENGKASGVRTRSGDAFTAGSHHHMRGSIYIAVVTRTCTTSVCHGPSCLSLEA